MQALLFFAFSSLFFGVGVLLFGSATDRLEVSLFIAVATTVFAVQITPMGAALKRAVGFLHTSRAEQKAVVRNLLLCSAGGPGLLLFWYWATYLPLTAENAELARVEFAEDYGVWLRISVQLCYFVGVLSVYVWRSRIGSRALVSLLWLLGLVALAGTAFRGRVVDYLALTIISWLVLNKLEHGRYVRSAARAFVYASVSISAAVTAIYVVTAVRLQSASTAAEVWEALLVRLFVVNVEVNIARCVDFVRLHGPFYGMGYVRDIISLVDPTVQSVQEVVTSFYNPTGAATFVMTPTVLGEMYLNFGAAYWIVGPVTILLYRVLAESPLSVIAKLRGVQAVVLPTAITLIYYFPRQVVTGGLSNALLVRGGSIYLCMALLLLATAAVAILKRR